MAQPEAKFKAKMRECFKSFYALQHHFHFAIVANMMQKSGVPDDYFAAENKTAWVEAKANGKWLEPSQQLVIPQMVNAGLRVVIVDADMTAKEDVRKISFSDFLDQTLRRNRLTFLWRDLSSHLFWRTVLGIYA